MKVKNGEEENFKEFIEINSHDGYSRAGSEYAVRWAELMEKERENGKSIRDMAKVTSHQADTEGITGFMYGCAVSALAQLWEHGEELRKWHNAKYNHHGDGVVNPAIITVGERK